MKKEDIIKELERIQFCPSQTAGHGAIPGTGETVLGGSRLISSTNTMPATLRRCSPAPGQPTMSAGTWGSAI